MQFDCISPNREKTPVKLYLEKLDFLSGIYKINEIREWFFFFMNNHARERAKSLLSLKKYENIYFQ